MEKKLTREELLRELIEKAKDVFTTCEQKMDIEKILKESTNFKGRNHLFLARCYFRPEDALFSVSEEEALSQSYLALKEGSNYAYFYLYFLLREKEPVKARNCLRLACDCAYPDAYLEMADCKREGKLFTMDYEGALSYYRKAALSGRKEGYEGMMVLYLELGDIENEKKVYEEATAKGFVLSGVIE